MDDFLFPLILFVIFIGIPIVVGLLIYTIPKKLGYPRFARYLLFTYGFICLLFTCYLFFSDYFFTKPDALKLVEEQGITLVDEFNITNYNSSFAIGESYETFTLNISNLDKQKAISKIINSKNFHSTEDSNHIESYNSLNQYWGSKIIQNYETEDAYVREYFKPSGQKNYAPTFRKITIRKLKNELIYEDIDE
ncbi:MULTISPECIES: hypothetical protein [unclassified Sphingobacterium]|uniref:hypothetical protein n=1 Tax=unclassified Sphingobacterium TaxID=2609468 RepID=UPI0010487816|nr:MULTISPECIES: hypothetical protein [unclassified Sphingobacterium]MCS3556445.1 hypothetical protein [Sphingobacterium sp. JUb21]TCR08811.1 hypothetical protein EDF66_103363 [Sphingobacterium sp. JUb20]